MQIAAYKHPVEAYIRNYTKNLWFLNPTQLPTHGQ